jgi:translation initiation factor IF-2
MHDYTGTAVTEATPGMPVEILGLSEPPQAGDRLKVTKSEREARNTAHEEKETARVASLSPTPRHNLQDILQQMAADDTKELNIVLRADVRGTAEAIAEQLNKLKVQEVSVKVISVGVGSASENDVLLARAAGAIIVCFNTQPEPGAKRAAKDGHIDIRQYGIIYELLEDIELAAKGMLAPTFEEVVQGSAEVRRVFKLSKGITVAGCYVIDGKIIRSGKARVLRGESTEPVFSGNISGLKHIKEDIREAAAGFECGILLEGFIEFAEGDTIVCFTVEQVNA